MAFAHDFNGKAFNVVWFMLLFFELLRKYSSIPISLKITCFFFQDWMLSSAYLAAIKWSCFLSFKKIWQRIIKWIIKKYFANFYANKFENLVEIDASLGTICLEILYVWKYSVVLRPQQFGWVYHVWDKQHSAQILQLRNSNVYRRGMFTFVKNT